MGRQNRHGPRFHTRMDAMTRTLHTFGDAAKHGMLVTFTCQACDYRTSMLASELAKVVSPLLTLQDERFTCSQCGSRKAKAVYDFWDMPPPNSVIRSAGTLGKPMRSPCSHRQDRTRTGFASPSETSNSGSTCLATASAATIMATLTAPGWSAVWAETRR